jgi:lipoprotein-anchoring transpeptidase ErfK/SrfK
MRAIVLLLMLNLPSASSHRRPVVHAPRPAPAAFTAQDVIDAASTDTLAPPATGARVVRAQILLDRARFSPGEIDGQFGETLGAAVRGYQQANGQPATGTIDAQTWTLLNRDNASLFDTYTITEADVKGPFEPLPKDVHERAGLTALRYESPEEELGEKFHNAPKLLRQLNPGKAFDRAGEQITAPNVQRPAPEVAAKVVVSKSSRTVTALGAGGKVMAQYPATIGGEHDPLPPGTLAIQAIQHNPVFYYQAGRLWNADPADAKEKLPPGPNNPVGVVWMGLSRKHYGIHGTADPGTIRRSESSGCIRLTNWDADELSHMVRHGTPVVIEE